MAAMSLSGIVSYTLAAKPPPQPLNLEPINLHPKSFDTRAVFAVQWTYYKGGIACLLSAVGCFF